jgi:large conductance mechanosensitive channel protein
MNTMQQHYDNSVGQSGSELLASARGMKGSAAALGVNTEGLDNAIKKYSAALHDENISQDSAEFREIAAKLRAELDAVAAAASNAGEGFKKYEGALSGSAQKVASSQKEFEQLKSTLVTSSIGGKEFADGVEKAAKAAKAAGAVTLNYGAFINNVISFLIVACAVFAVIKAINTLKNKVCKEEVVEAESTTKECPFCCSCIPINAKKCPNCTSDLG